MRRLSVGSVLVVLTACGGSPASAPPDVSAASTAAVAPAQATPADVPAIVPRVMPTSAQAGRGHAVAFEELAGLLPVVDGWTRSDEKSEQLFKPVVTARAEALYRRGVSHVELELADSAGDQLFLAPISVFLANGYSERLESGSRQATRVNGYPAFEEWHPADRRGEVTVVVADRMIARAVGHDIASLDPVKRVILALDFQRLARLR